MTQEKAGQPEITVPKTDPPAQLQQVQPLIKGKGKEVGPNDTITFDYRWVRWSDGKLLEESYTGEPANAAPAVCCLMVQGAHRPDRREPGAAGDPPADGYPDGNPTPSVGPDETLVMVVDVSSPRRVNPGQ